MDSTHLLRITTEWFLHCRPTLQSIQKEKGALSKENALFRQQEITSCDASAASSSLRAFSMNAPHCSASSGSNLTYNPGTESRAHFASTDSLSVVASSGRVYAARTASSTSRADNSVFSLMTHLSGSSLQNGIEPVVCFSQVQRIFPKWLSQWPV